MGRHRAAQAPPAQVVLEAPDPDLHALQVRGDRGDPLRERRVRSRVVGSHHDEHPVGRGEGPLPSQGLLDPAGELPGIPGPSVRLPVEVAEGQVLGEDRAPVGGLPPEHVPVDGPGDPAPDDGVLDAGRAEDLRHLPDVAELVGQVADLQGPAELASPSQPHLEVPDVRLPRDEEGVHLRDPRPRREPAGADVTPEVGLALGADREVVIDHRGLPVQVEVGEPAVGELEERVHHGDEPGPELREGRVPLAVPVGVRHERDALHGPSLPRPEGSG